MIVVCDTSPVNYLVLIDGIDLLPQLFTTVVLPAGVLAEPPSQSSWTSRPVFAAFSTRTFGRHRH